MKTKLSLGLIVGMFFLQSCSTNTNETLWISGFKTVCGEESHSKECFYVTSNASADSEEWEMLDATIEGFNFEEGMLTKIEVKTEEDDTTNLSNVSYVFVKEVDKKTDPRIELNENWVLTTLKGGVLNKMVVLPTLQLDLKEMKISGNGGCNHYFGRIEKLTLDEVELGAIGVTQMLCDNQNIEDEYFEALSKVEGFSIKENKLSLIDEEGSAILTYIKG